MSNMTRVNLHLLSGKVFEARCLDEDYADIYDSWCSRKDEVLGFDNCCVHCKDVELIEYLEDEISEKKEESKVSEQEIKEDFLLCYKLANDLASRYPEKSLSWIGSVSERLRFFANTLIEEVETLKGKS